MDFDPNGNAIPARRIAVRGVDVPSTLSPGLYIKPSPLRRFAV
jgi:hypothetical protein